jgi:hypothetical protein
MTKKEVATVARYILYQHLRTPAQRLFSQRLGELSHHAPDIIARYRALYRELAPNGRLPMTRSERKLDQDAWIEGIQSFARARLDSNKHLWLRPIHRFADALVPVLESFAWCIAELPREVSDVTPFVTCDNPVVLARKSVASLRDPKPGWDVAIGGGWQELTLQVTLTLSPRHALLLVRDPLDLALAEDPARLAESVRVRTARHAFEYVYARNNDPRIAELVKATTPPRIVFDVAGEKLPSDATMADLLRKVAKAGVGHFGVRYTDE